MGSLYIDFCKACGTRAAKSMGVFYLRQSGNSIWLGTLCYVLCTVVSYKAGRVMSARLFSFVFETVTL
eukprot:scaffold3450_cov114-Cylindrotheca_fusiformis.AAC.9